MNSNNCGGERGGSGPRHCQTQRPYEQYEPRPQSHSHLALCPQLVCPILCSKSWLNRHRSSSLQRQELLKIIQANMDKHSLRFQTNRYVQVEKPALAISNVCLEFITGFLTCNVYFSRKRCTNEMAHGHVNTGISTNVINNETGRSNDLMEEEHSYQKPLKLREWANIMSSNNYLVNLSSLQSGELYGPDRSKTYVPYCEYDTAALLNAVVNMNMNMSKQVTQLAGRPSSGTGPITGAASTDPAHHHTTLGHGQCKCSRHHHHRLKANECVQLPVTYRFVGSKRHALNKKNNIFSSEFTRRPKTLDKTCTKSKYFESKYEQFPQRRSSGRKISRVILSHSPSPHHLKHRNRKEDQARAMAQVVRWLEKEVSTNISIRAKLEKRHNTKSKTHIPEKKTSGHSKANSPCAKHVQKHEHHHVHKHIHHHYHHFREE